MPNYQDSFTSKWLRAADLKGKIARLTIENVTTTKNQEGNTQLVLHFKGTEKQLGLNRINAATIAELTRSDDTDDWIGHQIELKPAKTEFKGERVDCIRVNDEYHRAPGQTAAAAPQSKQEPPPREYAFGGDDDDIAF